MPQNKPMKIQWITVNGRQVPLVLPQTYSYEIEDWKVTSDRDPLPVGNYIQTESGVWIPQKGSDDGAADVRITGRNVERILVFNAVAMDTTELYSQTFDVSKFQQIHVLAINTLNEAIMISMRIDGNWVRSENYNDSSWALATIEPSGSFAYSLNTYKPFLFQNVINTVRFYIRTENPPTSGSVTIKILGRY